MLGIKLYAILNRLFRIFRRRTSIVLIAVMLGISNAIMEEDRTLYDTRNHLEERDIPSDDDPF